MEQDNIDKLEQKKQELEAELQSIQHELDDSIDRVRHDISDKLDPKSFIRKHPLPVVGGAVLLGFLIGHNDKEPPSAGSHSSDDKLSRTIIYELKRLATKKALSFAGDFIENKFGGGADLTAGISNGIDEE